MNEIASSRPVAEYANRSGANTSHRKRHQHSRSHRKINRVLGPGQVRWCNRDSVGLIPFDHFVKVPTAMRGAEVRPGVALLCDPVECNQADVRATH